MKQLDSFPKVKLGVFPTPIQRLANISRRLNTNVYVKRDDLTGLGLGGNKIRKLEYLLADARRKGAQVVFTTGGAQSNHAMLTAAAAGKMGMRPILILKKRGVTELKGNQLLEHLMGTEVILMDTDDYADIYAEMDRIGTRMGVPYYKIPCGGSNALGARLFLPETKVHGMMVDSEPFDRITPALMRETAELLETDAGMDAEGWDLRDMTGPGYALPSAEGNAAIRLMAREEGLFLDPVYTGKAFAGLLQMAEEGAFRADDNVLFLHSGGAGGIFAVL
ncbi:MAG: pyridoxal-phosphate dependent enzyme [Clostridia bacterium]|nr:pyridoxal-phosphate dependent enzyme [Clostridia bacterium]